MQQFSPEGSGIIFLFDKNATPLIINIINPPIDIKSLLSHINKFNSYFPELVSPIFKIYDNIKYLDIYELKKDLPGLSAGVQFRYYPDKGIIAYGDYALPEWVKNDEKWFKQVIV